MNAAITLDLFLTVALCTALVTGGLVSLWLLPWTDAERAVTVRAFGEAARRTAALGRSPVPARFVPARAFAR
jgi:hypothetical protein